MYLCAGPNVGNGGGGSSTGQDRRIWAGREVHGAIIAPNLNRTVE